MALINKKLYKHIHALDTYIEILDTADIGSHWAIECYLRNYWLGFTYERTTFIISKDGEDMWQRIG